MDEKRYQVFISSTYEDLKDERRAVQDVVISTGDFPVQMESFPAADEDQFEFIKSLINHCDYYILIIAGRYGSLDGDGLSYTHKEYRYAVAQGIPVLVMLRADINKIEVGKSEQTDDGRLRLRSFIKEAESNRLRKEWTTLEGLKLAVREALDNAKATKPRVGWVRGDSIASLKALEELNEVRKENAEFRKAISALEIEVDIPAIPNPKDALTIHLLSDSRRTGSVFMRGSDATIATTWIDIFPVFQENLRWESNRWNGGYGFYEEDSCVAIGSAIAGIIQPIDAAGCFKITKDTLKRLMNYYIEAGLMNDPGAEEPFTQLAEKIARRHSILAGTKGNSFEVIKGAISISRSSQSVDDDIPF